MDETIKKHKGKIIDKDKYTEIIQDAKDKNKKKSCYQCKDRTLSCHSTCESYLAAKAKRKKIKENKREFYNPDLASHIRENQARINKVVRELDKKFGGEI